MKSVLMLAAWMVAAVLWGGDVTFTLLTPEQAVVAGDEVQVNLVVLNTASYENHYSAREGLAGVLSDGTRSWQVMLTRVEAGTAAIPARGFAYQTYRFDVPKPAKGRMILELREPEMMRAVLDVKPAANVLALEKQSVSAPLTQMEKPPAAARIKRAFLENFSAHEPMYLIGGPERPAVKFQFSFKYQFLSNEGPLARAYPALRGLHFGYTQRSIWDITAKSAPFYDTSYMPEVFYESLAAETGKRGSGVFTWLGYHLGAGHESNGSAQNGSRSTNIVYFRPAFSFGDLEGWRLIVVPKFYAYVGDLSDNRDLDRYRGYAELRAVIGRNNGLGLGVLGRVGRDFERGGVQLDLTYPANAFFGNFAAYYLVQYWNGYGESLRDYDRRSESWRAGFSLVR